MFATDGQSVLASVDSRSEARLILESGAAKLAQTVVDTDDAAIALKALGKRDVVREKASLGSNTMLVMLGTLEQPLQPPANRGVGPGQSRG